MLIDCIVTLLYKLKFKIVFATLICKGDGEFENTENDFFQINTKVTRISFIAKRLLKNLLH